MPKVTINRIEVEAEKWMTIIQAAYTAGLNELDSDRCVHCSRCVRFTEDVTKTGEMAFFNRGGHVEIGTIENRPVLNPYSGNIVDVCPVGALTSKDFRFQSRVWFLKYADSICN